jgi:hypothetical protein
MTTSRVREEWRARIVAEYMSATITQHLVLWLMQAAAPRELVDAGLAIVADELAHSRSSEEVYLAAGGTTLPVFERSALGLARVSRRLEDDILLVGVRVFCLGETVAVPLFRQLRESCTQPVARQALDRILRDEVRHRELGWDLLDWMISVDGPAAVARVTEVLPAMFGELEASYGRGNVAVAEDDGEISEVERAWGLAPPREYAEVLARTIERDYRPRFNARGIVLPTGVT